MPRRVPRGEAAPWKGRLIGPAAVFALFKEIGIAFDYRFQLRPNCSRPMFVRSALGYPMQLRSVFGGTAPAVALYFKSLGHEHWFYYYLSGMIFLSLLIYASMRDTKHQSAMHRHE